MEKLLDTAYKILELNWRDGFTIPANRLYPFQWNWDSGFVSLGLSYASLSRAMQELSSLFSGQWQNGMVPHIIFHSESETTYFPNFDFWESNVNPGAPQKPKSSGITQPPVHGFILENLLQKYPNRPELITFAREIYPKILAFHQFLYTYRDPYKEGLVFIYHPWESGRDNSPLWDASLDRIEIDRASLPSYIRRDTSIADATERPTNAQYDRYVHLIQLGKVNQYDGEGIAQESPFLIQDAMFNAILIKSNQSLIQLADQLGLDPGPLPDWQQQSIQAFNQKLWHPALQVYVPYDLRIQAQIEHKEIGGIAPIFAGIPDQTQAQQMADYLMDLHQRGFFLVPSFDVDSPLFDSKRYWRGPVWPQMNWLIYQGLKAYGFAETADLVRTDLIELVSRLGFYEYFESQKSLVHELNRGYGGDLFSWTASSIIDLIHAS